MAPDNKNEPNKDNKNEPNAKFEDIKNNDKILSDLKNDPEFINSIKSGISSIKSGIKKSQEPIAKEVELNDPIAIKSSNSRTAAINLPNKPKDQNNKGR